MWIIDRYFDKLSLLECMSDNTKMPIVQITKTAAPNNKLLNGMLKPMFRLVFFKKFFFQLSPLEVLLIQLLSTLGKNYSSLYSHNFDSPTPKSPHEAFISGGLTVNI